MIRLGHEHDKDVQAIEDFCHDKDSLSRQTCLVAKKKYDTLDLGRHKLVSEVRYVNYLELNVWYKQNNLVLVLRFMIT